MRRWGTIRLRMTLWNVAVLALIVEALGRVVRYTVQAELFAAVVRALAERMYNRNVKATQRQPITWQITFR